MEDQQSLMEALDMIRLLVQAGQDLLPMELLRRAAKLLEKHPS